VNSCPIAALPFHTLHPKNTLHQLQQSTSRLRSTAVYSVHLLSSNCIRTQESTTLRYYGNMHSIISIVVTHQCCYLLSTGPYLFHCCFGASSLDRMSISHTMPSIVDRSLLYISNVIRGENFSSFSFCSESFVCKFVII
jgi:hypothetical protein